MMTKEEKAQYMKNWRSTHREKVREANRKWKQAHSDQVKESYHKYYTTNRVGILEKVSRYARSNKDKVNEKIRRWSAKNRDKVSKKAMKWQRANPEKAKENKRAWANTNPEKIKTSHLKRYYGITFAEYQELFKNQNGKCAVCGSDNDGTPLCIDHDHATGKIRGLLCKNCNSGIGFLRDDINTIEKAFNYLKNFISKEQ